ncbi:hypothetical protein Xentx_00262 [Xenorhabdus thuongxuanensis]|uniref:Uncharacterized protein n=1 Tax=Xenorhabdus thuongxuanensis TaxID=1873484 RepID=A0A1Q5U9M8_9GAMM|nr:hypothetical protein Xentx_00262 [Xenorhabdus thuongxuanensis]
MAWPFCFLEVIEQGIYIKQEGRLEIPADILIKPTKLAP